MLLASVLLVAAVEPAVPSYVAEFTENSPNITVINYEGRTPPRFGLIDGQPALGFSKNPNERKADTMWGVETAQFKVTGGREYFVLLEMQGDIPAGDGIPGAAIYWQGADGKPLMYQDALGKRSALKDRLNTPSRAIGRGRVKAYTRGIVPKDAVGAKIRHAVDRPDLGKKRRIAYRNLAYYEHVKGQPYELDDIEPPVLTMPDGSPLTDLYAPIRFTITDKNGIDWTNTVIKIDGNPVPKEALELQDGVFSYRPSGAWANDSLHRVEINATDNRGNSGFDCGFVAFTDKRPRHPCATIRDDGMLLVDGKARYPLGWFRVRPASGNNYDLNQGVREMRDNGMNMAHTYMVHGIGGKREQELFDELVRRCEQYGVMLYTEPSNRKPKTPEFLPLAAENLFRGLGYGAPLFWGIGDDTSIYTPVDELKYMYRCCKAVDPLALTISADVSTSAEGQSAYIPYADMLFLEIYPITELEPQDREMAQVAQCMDDAWKAVREAGIAERSVVAIPQAFKGWKSWKRLPTADEVRCQAYIAIACRARGVVYYASCGARSNCASKTGEPEKLENFGPWDIPEYKESFFKLMRDLGDMESSLVLRDAAEQPKVEILEGPALNVLGSASVRCLMKADGLLVAANTSHLPVKAKITTSDGRSIVHSFSRNGVLADRPVVDETAALQDRIDRVSARGGGRVTLTRGVHDISSVCLRDDVELYLEAGAVLRGSRDPDAYMMDFGGRFWSGKSTNRWSNAMIRLLGVKNVSIVGEPGSVIDGRNCFDATGEEGFRGPHAISAYAVTNLTLRGVQIRDAGNFALYTQNAAEVLVEGIVVQGGHDSLDFFGCSNVNVRNCVLHSGDDCIAGYNNTDLTVRGCDLNTACNLFRIGGNHILIENCWGMAPAENPHRWSLGDAERRLERTPVGAGRRTTLSFFTFFTGKSARAVSSDIVFRDCHFSGVEQFMHYNLSGNERWQCGSGLHDVVFENVHLEGVKHPICAYSNKDAPLRMSFRDSSIAFREPVRNLVRGAWIESVDRSGLKVDGVTGPDVRYWDELKPQGATAEQAAEKFVETML